jgi:hypothetical protein
VSWLYLLSPVGIVMGGDDLRYRAVDSDVIEPHHLPVIGIVSIKPSTYNEASPGL